jgi:hypothetical protein
MTERTYLYSNRNMGLKVNQASSAVTKNTYIHCETKLHCPVDCAVIAAGLCSVSRFLILSIVLPEVLITVLY